MMNKIELFKRIKGNMKENVWKARNREINQIMRSYPQLLGDAKLRNLKTNLKWNQIQIGILEETGDFLPGPMPVGHFHRFKSKKDMKSFIKEVTANGFSVKGTHHYLFIKGFSYSTTIVREAQLDIDSIDSLTLEMWRAACKFEGKYFGWEPKYNSPASENQRLAVEWRFGDLQKNIFSMHLLSPLSEWMLGVLSWD